MKKSKQPSTPKPRNTPPKNVEAKWVVISSNENEGITTTTKAQQYGDAGCNVMTTVSWKEKTGLLTFKLNSRKQLIPGTEELTVNKVTVTSIWAPGIKVIIENKKHYLV